MNKTPIAIAEDDEIYRLGLTDLITKGNKFDVIKNASNGKAICQFLDTTKLIPEIILTDMKMPEMDGLELTKYIKTYFPSIKVAILTGFYSKVFLKNMIMLGAAAFLKKDISPGQLEPALIKVHKTGFFYDDEMKKIISEANNYNQKITRKAVDEHGLSERELEVLKLICKQKTTSEIGEKLFISPRTVDGHRNHLLEKTNSKNIAGLVLFAVEKGIYYFK